MESSYHESVMVKEVLESLHVNKGSLYIDATLGTGGHALEIIKAGGKIFGIEADPEILEIAKKRVAGGNFVLGNFTDIDKIARENDFGKVSGVLFDLGVTNIHLTTGTRGFSFGSPNNDLDMRLNAKDQGVMGADLLNALREDQLIDLFRVTLDGGSAKWMTKRVLEARPVRTVADFLAICRGLRGKPGLNEATLPFLALRVAVNSELDILEAALPKAYELLEPRGKLVVISFHSGEDRIVKNFGDSRLILPSAGEIAKNPRARSAKMRVFEKT